MKQFILLVAVVAIALTGCKDGGNGQKLDPDAMISLRAAQGVKSDTKAENPKHLSALEIVKQASIISWVNKAYHETKSIERVFSPDHRDFVNQRLLMFGTDIITSEGKYMPAFIEGEDFILIIKNYQNIVTDTIAYIPNQVIKDAKAIIKPAFDRGDYETVYNAFNNAFTYTPITGDEWRALKAAGKN